jgi:hypothetical protein
MQAELLIERIKGIPLIRLPSLRDPVKQNKAMSLTASLIDVMLQ